MGEVIEYRGYTINAFFRPLKPSGFLPFGTVSGEQLNICNDIYETKDEADKAFAILAKNYIDKKLD